MPEKHVLCISWGFPLVCVCIEMSSIATVFSSKHCNSPFHLLARCGSWRRL